MGTNALLGSADTREKLLAAAAREFSAHGYDGASLRQICSVAGVTTGALYFFFKNKEDLFRTVVAPVTEPVAAVLSAAEERAGNTSQTEAIARADGLLEADRAEMSPYGLLELFYERRELVLIMVRNRDCPVMGRSIARVRAAIAEYVRRYLEDSGSTFVVWDDLVIDWLADVVLSSITEILETDASLPAARRHLRIVFEFVRGGIATLSECELGAVLD